jgi:hypothetical protein
VFLNRTGGRLSLRAADEAICAVATAAGLADVVTPHVLRHQFGTDLIRAGVDMVTVAELNGRPELPERNPGAGTDRRRPGTAGNDWWTAYFDRLRREADAAAAGRERALVRRTPGPSWGAGLPGQSAAVDQQLEQPGG